MKFANLVCLTLSVTFIVESVLTDINNFELMSLLTIGTCTEQPGSISRGRVDLFEQPLDPEDRTLALSVVILSGKRPGPTVLVTANIHGDEVCPTIVAHRVIEHIESRLDELCGRVVVFPTLNPTGHLNNTRFPQFEAQDPNRFWPDANPEAASNRAKAAREQGDWLGEFTYLTSEPKPIERCWNAVFELFRACKPDFHVDLHTICHLSIPFQFLDRVLYSENADGSNRLAAEDLFQRTRAMCEAIGITIVLENSPKVYTKKDLHRSTSGAVLNVLRVPAVTFELGGNSIAEPGARDAGVQGLSLTGLFFFSS
jgi:predicted deacylase